jgi:hypothetical protein
MVNGSSGVKRRQNIPQLADMFRVYAARVRPVRTAVSVPGGELPVSFRNVTRHVAHVNNNVSKIVAAGYAWLRSRSEAYNIRKPHYDAFRKMP